MNSSFIRSLDSPPRDLCTFYIVLQYRVVRTSYTDVQQIIHCPHPILRFSLNCPFSLTSVSSTHRKQHELFHKHTQNIETDYFINLWKEIQLATD